MPQPQDYTAAKATYVNLNLLSWLYIIETSTAGRTRASGLRLVTPIDPFIDDVHK